MIKQRFSYITAASVILCTIAMLGCGNNEQKFQAQLPSGIEASNKPKIAATNAAINSMTRVIVGDFADVDQPQIETGSGRGLDVEQVLQLQNADLVFTNGPGANDAAWLDLISLDTARVHATTSDQFELDDFIQVEDYRTVHSHGDEGEHSHPWLVPQSWLNPRLAKAQSMSILNRLVKTFPEQESGFRERHRDLVNQLSDLEKLATEVAELLEAKKVRVIVSDPRLLFFTRALDLEDNYLLWFELPAAEPAIAELRKRLPVDDKKMKTLLLWAQDAGSLDGAVAKATGVENAHIHLIEDDVSDTDPSDDVSFVDQLRENFETVRATLEEMND